VHGVYDKLLSDVVDFEKAFLSNEVMNRYGIP
jgi:hypothetical protein